MGNYFLDIQYSLNNWYIWFLDRVSCLVHFNIKSIPLKLDKTDRTFCTFKDDLSVAIGPYIRMVLATFREYHFINIEQPDHGKPWPWCTNFTMCTIRSDPFCIVSYYKKWVPTSWTHSSYFSINIIHLSGYKSIYVCTKKL